MSALTALAMAQAAGVSLAAEGSDLRVEADSEPPADLLAALREHKPELVALLTGQACRRCGGAIDDRGVRAWIPFADNTAAHLECEDAWYVEDVMRRARNALSPETLADEAEVTMRGELS